MKFGVFGGVNGRRSDVNLASRRGGRKLPGGGSGSGGGVGTVGLCQEADGIAQLLGEQDYITLVFRLFCLILSGFVFYGCYYGPTRPVLLPIEEARVNATSIAVAVEAPKVRFSIDSTSHETINTASLGFRWRASRKMAYEFSSSGIQLELLHFANASLQVGTVHKIGLGLEGDYFGLTSSSHLLAFMNLAQVNWKLPFVQGAWVGTGIESDLRGYEYSSGSNSETGIRSIIFREYDVFLIQSAFQKIGPWWIQVSVNSPPLINRPGYTVKFKDFDTPENTGAAWRRPHDYTWRFGVSRSY